MPSNTPNSVTGHTDLSLSGEMSMHETQMHDLNENEWDLNNNAWIRIKLKN